MLIVEQRAQAHERQAVAGIDGDRHAVLPMKCRLSTTLLALVFDVVMNEERVVEQLDGNCGRQGFLDASAHDASHGDADAGAHHLATPHGVIGEEVVEVSARLAYG